MYFNSINTNLQGVDQIGQLIKQFRKLTKGLSALRKETEETIPRFEEDKYDYPANHLKGKYLPWRNEMANLGVQQTSEQVETSKEKKQALGMKLNLMVKKK